MSAQGTHDLTGRPEDVLFIGDVARLLNCTERTVYAFIHRGDLAEPFHVGNRSAWHRRDLDRLLARPKRGLRRRRPRLAGPGEGVA